MPVATEGLMQFPPSFLPLDSPHISWQYLPDESLHRTFNNHIDGYKTIDLDRFAIAYTYRGEYFILRVQIGVLKR